MEKKSLERRKTMMRPGFRLNCHDRDLNPLFESHDPSMFYDPMSGYYYSYSTDSAITSEYRPGIPIRKSNDLINFEFVGYALSDEAIAEARDNGRYAPTPGFWAPFAEYVKGEYRLYYSATRAFGSSESRIYLAVADNPEGPFENRGVVVDTWGTDNSYPNAIDPHVVDDPHGGKYLIYGSFFGGIYIKELARETGLALSGDAHELGRLIAHKPAGSYIDGPEGAAVIRNPQNGNYYLFLSYGWLGDDYDIRVGLSRRVEGPYRDRDGKSLNGESLGTKLAGSYCFSAEAPYADSAEQKKRRTLEVRTKQGVRKESVNCRKWRFDGFRGPGHGVPFYNVPDGSYYFVHHMRDGAAALVHEPTSKKDKRSYRMHYMVVRRMYFINDWPVLSPEPYAGEARADGRVYRFDVAGGVPVGADAPDAAYARTEAQPDAAAERDAPDTEGAWEWIVFSNTDNELVRGSTDLSLSGVTALVGEAFDFENSCLCRVLCGYTDDGRSVWAKRG
ncbi:MAG: arabinan endo-1,5-alpha-L-arabinosidase [Clostridium sp.]|nr:arabinan endo-1,5-alpha-L-arabinosidase [Clostridium sp.]